MILPQYGRFLIRRFDDHSHLIGVLHFGPGFKPVEGASYAMIVASRAIIVMPEMLDDGIPHELEGKGVDALLFGKCWRRTEVKATLTVRFLSAFPETNGWTVVGVANQPLLPRSMYSENGHSWNDVLEGECKVIPSPATTNEYGKTTAQLLSDLAVWPNGSGRLLPLPTVESPWRTAHRQYTNLLLRYGASEITLEALTAAIASDPAIARVATQVDHGYCQELAARRALGAPHTASAQEARAWSESNVMAAHLLGSLTAGPRRTTA